MVSREGLYQINFNSEERQILFEKFGTVDKSELIKKIKDLALSKTVELSISARREQAKLRIDEANARIKESQAIYWETFKQPPTPQAHQAITHSVPAYSQPQTPKSEKMLQDDLTLKCVTCGKIFPRRAFDFEQADDYFKHVRADHRRELYEGERKILAELANH